MAGRKFFKKVFIIFIGVLLCFVATAVVYKFIKVKKLKNIVLFGKPASGKGTYSSMLAKEYNLYHLSSGQALRNCIEDEKCKYNEQVKEYINQGRLVPKRMVNKILVQDIRKNVLCVKCKYNGIIFDGFPRSKENIGFFRRYQIDVYKAINIDVTDEEVIKRIANRKDGRADDRDKKAILNRLNVYNEDTKYAIEFFDKKGILEDVNGIGTKEHIYNSIKKAIDFEK